MTYSPYLNRHRPLWLLYWWDNCSILLESHFGLFFRIFQEYLFLPYTASTPCSDAGPSHRSQIDGGWIWCLQIWTCLQSQPSYSHTRPTISYYFWQCQLASCWSFLGAGSMRSIKMHLPIFSQIDGLIILFSLLTAGRRLRKLARSGGRLFASRGLGRYS